MNIEPAILVMHHSIKPHPAITATLLDFLCRIITNFFPREQEKVRNGIYSSLRSILEKRVLPSLSPLFDHPKMDQELKFLLRERFSPFVKEQVSLEVSLDDDHPIIVESSNSYDEENAIEDLTGGPEFSDDEPEGDEGADDKNEDDDDKDEVVKDNNGDQRTVATAAAALDIPKQKEQQPPPPPASSQRKKPSNSNSTSSASIKKETTSSSASIKKETSSSASIKKEISSSSLSTSTTNRPSPVKVRKRPVKSQTTTSQ